MMVACCRCAAMRRRRARRPTSRLLAVRICRKGESKDLIERLLGDTVKCYTTHCVQRELKKLGKEYAGQCEIASSDSGRLLPPPACHQAGRRSMPSLPKRRCPPAVEALPTAQVRPR